MRVCGHSCVMIITLPHFLGCIASLLACPSDFASLHARGFRLYVYKFVVRLLACLLAYLFACLLHCSLAPLHAILMVCLLVVMACLFVGHLGCEISLLMIAALKSIGVVSPMWHATSLPMVIELRHETSMAVVKIVPAACCSPMSRYKLLALVVCLVTVLIRRND